MATLLARVAVSAALLVLVTAGCHNIGSETERQAAAAAGRTGFKDPAETNRLWWRAFALADTVTLSALSAPDLGVTLSSGRTFDRAAALAESQSYTTGARLTLDWSDESFRPVAGSGVVVLSARLRETEGRTVNRYRMTTILERRPGVALGWRVVLTQSTREVAAAARLARSEAGDLTVFAGRYRVPSGAALVVAVQDSALTLSDPNGAVQRLEAIGPSLFESTRVSGSNGVVRFAFARDSAGRVRALSRVIQSGVVTFPRAADSTDAR